jgi:GntR family transcriptional regulator, carbon starvation induced regulator
MEKTSIPGSAGGTAGTLVEQATALIRRDIVMGQLQPNARLGVHALAERYGIGITPVREALSRLCTAGFVVAIEQKGFRVSDLNRRDLEDLVLTRQVVETTALRLSIAKGDDKWEGGVVAALHRLEKFSAANGPRAFEKAPAAYDEVHRAFHFALIAACDSSRLLRLHNDLYDQTFRYRCFQMSRDARLKTISDEHASIAQLVLDRDADAACSALSIHLGTLLGVAATTSERGLLAAQKTAIST